jgi:hypothetical protein
MKERREREQRKRHRTNVGNVPLRTRGRKHVEARGGEPHHDPHESDAEEIARAEQAGLRVPRVLLHLPRIGRVDAERERGKAIGDEVDPEDLERRRRKRAADERHGEDGDGEPRIGREQEENELLDVAVDRSTFSHGVDDRGEVVVGEDEVGGLARDVGARAAHGDADVRLFQGRRVVDAVARHRHDVTERAVRVHDAELLLGRGAREHPQAHGFGAKRVVAHLGELGAGDDAVPRSPQVELLGDGDGRDRMIARDHDDPDARLVAHANGFFDGASRRVLHGDDPEQRERLLGVVSRAHAPRDRQNAQRLCAHPVRLGLHARLVFVGDAAHAFVGRDLGAER